MNIVANTWSDPTAVELPASVDSAHQGWGSDAIAQTLRDLELPYLALNPGASYASLHDSLVNHLGNRAPQMLVCLHEEQAVAIAQGYYKVTGKPMGVLLHSNVGLMHGTMAIFNAWCDRAPMLIIGATGPVDAKLRRPWIDWLHTCRDQSSLVSGYVKWSDQPASPGAAQEAILRGHQIACTAPRGPVYICLDTSTQEQKLAQPLPALDIARFQPPPRLTPGGAPLEQAVALLSKAKRLVILVGRMSHNEQDWAARVALAERLGATVLNDLKNGATFPSEHPLHGPVTKRAMTAEANECLRSADVVLSLDWIDLAGTLHTAWKGERISATVIQASLDQHNHNGWSMEYQALPPVDLYLMADPDATVDALLAALGPAKSPPAQPVRYPAVVPPAGDIIRSPHIAAALRAAIGDRPVCFTGMTRTWGEDLWAARHPLDYVSRDGGAGVGSGPGLAVGAAVALQGSGRMPIAIVGDGDFLMSSTAVWTAVHYRVPLLMIVGNNRAYGNCVGHAEKIAKQRSRAQENAWIGTQITDPEPDIAAISRGYGAVGIGPVTDPAKLPAAIAEAVAAVAAGACCVVDVHTPN